jgi:hypothetical protein
MTPRFQILSQYREELELRMTITALTRAGRFSAFSRACALAFLLLAVAAGAGAAAPIRGQYVEGEALVLLKNDGVRSAAASAFSAEAASVRAASVAEASGARLERVYEALSAHSGYVFAFVRSAKTTEQLIADLKNDPRVLSASPNRVYRAFKTPNDPEYGKMWGLEKIGAPQA